MIILIQIEGRKTINKQRKKKKEKSERKNSALQQPPD